MDRNLRNIAFIGLGSNKGNKLFYLSEALSKISLIKNVKLLSVSSVYETKPFGIQNQENFYNSAAKLATDLDPVELLTELKHIEKGLGRISSEKWGPREIDIDLLLYNDLIFSNDFISLPHKGIIYRDFVLQPLCDIEPELIHPQLKKKLNVILSEVKEKFIITKLPEKLFIPVKKIE